MKTAFPVALCLAASAALSLSTLQGCDTQNAPEPAKQIAADAAPPSVAPPPTNRPVEKQTVAVSAGQVDMITLKNGDVEVPGRFETLTGEIVIDPGAPSKTMGQITIDVSSWNSDLELRDTRMRDTFFVINESATATFAIKEVAGADTALAHAGDKSSGTAKGKLTWGAVELPMDIPVTMVRGEGDSYTVTSDAFDVSIAGLKMNEQLQKLITLCQHESVGDTVKATVSLTLGDVPAAAATTAAPVAGDPKAVKVMPRTLDAASTEGRTMDRDGKEAAPAESGARTLKKTDQ